MQEARQLEKPTKPEKVDSKLEKFLKFDNCCLKFDAYWDDRNSLSGDIHDLIVLYYLSDDTIQINEVPKRGKPTVLYKRLKLPKVIPINVYYFDLIIIIRESMYSIVFIVIIRKSTIF